MPDHLPPIATLRALEAAARHRSFTKAAAELNVTQSAISHQIRHMEALWGMALFARGARPLALTKAGGALAPVVREFLDRLTGTLAALREDDARGALRISMLESFALRWLVPRLGDFRAGHPEIDVWISTKDELVNFATDDVDLGIRLGKGDYSGLQVTFLFREYVFPVCSKVLLERLGVPKEPAELARFPLLLRHFEQQSPSWADWLRMAGVANISLAEGPRFPNSNMALQAAIDGQGVALVRSAHVDAELSSAGLVRLFNVHCPSDVAYYLVAPKDSEARAKIAAFRAWIVEQAERAQQNYDRAAAGPEG